MASRKIQTYQNKAKNLCTFILCLTWTVNANSLKQKIIVIKKYVLLSCHLGWVNKRRFYLQKGGSQQEPIHPIFTTASAHQPTSRWSLSSVFRQQSTLRAAAHQSALTQSFQIFSTLAIVDQPMGQPNPWTTVRWPKVDENEQSLSVCVIQGFLGSSLLHSRAPIQHSLTFDPRLINQPRSAALADPFTLRDRTDHVTLWRHGKCCDVTVWCCDVTVLRCDVTRDAVTSRMTLRRHGKCRDVTVWRCDVTHDAATSREMLWRHGVTLWRRDDQLRPTKSWWNVDGRPLLPCQPTVGLLWTQTTPLYTRWSDVTESMVTKRSPFCGYNVA